MILSSVESDQPRPTKRGSNRVGRCKWHCGCFAYMRRKVRSIDLNTVNSYGEYTNLYFSLHEIVTKIESVIQYRWRLTFATKQNRVLFTYFDIFMSHCCIMIF